MWNNKIPFNSKGEMMTYGGYSTIKWEDNFEFADLLKFDHFSRGRSKANAIMISQQTGRSFSMFMSDFADAIPSMSGGILKGTFTFCKRGSNYGLRML